MVSQMLDKLAGGQRTMVWLIANQHETAPPPPIRNAEMQAVLNELGVVTVIFQLTKDLERFAELRRLVFGDAAAQRRAGIRIRQAHAARGVFWRELAASGVAYLEAGEALLAMNPRQLSPDALGRSSSNSETPSTRPFATSNGSAPASPKPPSPSWRRSSRHRRSPLNWLDAVDRPEVDADYLAGYPDTHRAVISYLKSIHGSMYPEQAAYQPRTRYKHALHNFGSFDFDREILAMELLWFERADEPTPPSTASCSAKPTGACAARRPTPTPSPSPGATSSTPSSAT